MVRSLVRNLSNRPRNENDAMIYIKAYQFALLWPILLAAISIAVSTTLVYALVRTRSSAPSASVVGLATVTATFSLLGLAVGFLSAGSRESILGQVIPASLSLVGVLSAYLFVKQSEIKHFVLASAFALTLGILLGTVWGAEYRLQILYSNQVVDRKAALLRYCLIEEEKVREGFRILFAKEPELASATLKCQDTHRE